MGRVLILTGFPGVGKSAVGRALARRLGWGFLDLDEAVEAAAGRPIPRIFSEEGEEAFRDMETRALEQALRAERLVVAAGGGVLVRRRNRELLEGCIVVNLGAPLPVCLERLRRSPAERPLLQGEDPEGAAARLYEARAPLYRAVPRQVDTRGRSPDEVAEEILRRFGPEIEPCAG